MNKLLSISIFCLMFLSINAFAQKGVVKGKVTEKETGETAIGANVVIAGTTIGSPTDFEGNFSFEVEAGIYEINVSYIGFEKFVIKDLKVSAGEEIVLTIELSADNAMLDAVVVESESDKTSDVALIVERKKSTLAIENIGAMELKAKGISDVEGGLAKLSGISKVSSKGVFVRGLGDRYNNAYLNGLPIPSPNPDSKVIDLGIFPTAIVRNIDVSKVYSPNLYGDVSGASVNILTQNNVEENFLRIGTSFGYNTNVTGNDFYTTRYNKTADFLGFSSDARDADLELQNRNQLAFNTSEDDLFNEGFNWDKIKAPINQGYSISAGFRKDKLNVLYNLNYGNEYQFIEGKNLLLNASGSGIKEYHRSNYAYATNLTSLLTLDYAVSEKSNIQLNYLYVNNSNNTTSINGGYNEDRGEDITIYRNRFLHTNLNTLQLIGVQKFSDRINLDWAASYSRAFTGEPDRKELVFRSDFGDEAATISTLNENDHTRFFQETLEEEIAVNTEVSIGLGTKNSNTDAFNFVLKGGIQTRLKTRNVDNRSASVIIDPSFDAANTVFNVFNPDEFLSTADFGDNYFYQDGSTTGKNTSASRLIVAPYTFAEYQMSPKLLLIGGARAELTNQGVTYREFGFISNNTIVENRVDVLPSLNLKYNLDDNQIVRISMSQTLTRPNFRELLPFVFLDEANNEIVGNAKLNNTKNYNFDLNYSLYRKRGNFLSVGVFYKYLDSPIEKLRTRLDRFSFFNTTEATVAGIEIEAKQNLTDFIPAISGKLFEGINFGWNLSLMHSKVKIDIDGDKDLDPVAKNVTNTSRPLQGASPYIVNFDMGYDGFLNDKMDLSAHLVYNVFGQRIEAVGVNGTGDIYEIPVNTLDFITNLNINDKFSIGFSAKNLLNPLVRFEQEETQLTPDSYDGEIQDFRRGVRYGVSLSYRIF